MNIELQEHLELQGNEKDDYLSTITIHYSKKSLELLTSAEKDKFLQYSDMRIKGILADFEKDIENVFYKLRHKDEK